MSRKGAAPAAPIPNDEFQADATERAAAAMIPILEQMIANNPNRTIASLRRTDLQWLAIAAISGWVVARSEQHKRARGRLDIEAMIDDVPTLMG